MGEGRHRPTSLTVGELVDQWYAHKVEDLSPSTAAETRRIIGRVVKPRLGDAPLTKLTTSWLDRFYDDHRPRGRVEGGPMEAASVRRVHGIIPSCA